ncbi:TonB-dependent receptor [Patiriisocius marinistellae]|uniref:TonB-dependent receptor n=1 Tax=Patiriisocius marinistellae TaxID=2494560 RepID=A0A5J4G0M9_9FLAO|nr:TonB-dependent receptor [Patiriisocius marinistellae]GEQ86059.1 TonB-dependent receptor [Patiriisocius marinistellae]
MKQLSTILLLLVTLTTWSQQITVKGKVLESTSGLPLEFATVAFINQDGKIVTGGITDQKGMFSIEVDAGTYIVRYEFISFETKELPYQKLTSNITLSPVSLSESDNVLNEVVLRAETTEVQVRLDKKIYNIGKDLTTSGATVGDALNNVPSVTVDVEGAIALRGNENVRILINGKPSAIAGFGSTDALRQLPADAIERVEVITSPSARYDAEGTAGILNIILKKEKTLGINGSINTSVGVPTTSNVSGNINVRTDKFNIFNTTGYRYRNAPGNAFFSNFYKNIEPASGNNPLVTEKRIFEREDKSFNTNLGIEYYLTETSSITATGFLRFGNDDDVTTNTANEFNFDNDLAISRLRIENELEDDVNYQFSLNYVNNLSDDGHKLTADLQYEIGTEEENALITETNTFPNTTILPSEMIINLGDETEFLAQVDYVRPMGENAQFEAGARADLEETITDYTLLEEDVAGGTFIRDNGLSNVFTYNENVLAAYTQYGNKFGKFSFLLGLRVENTQLKGKVDGIDTSDNNNSDLAIDFDKNYTGLFPTVNLIYEIGERENVTLGYNRRINRPRGRFINPFPSRSSEANVFQGNPNLDPAYASAFDLGYIKRWDKLTLTSSIYYQNETNAFERIQEDTGELTGNGIPIIRTLPINLSTNERYGAEAGILYNPAKWLRLNGSFNYFLFKTEGAFNNVDYGTENSSWFARGSAKVSLPAKIDWQTNAFYRGPSNNAQTESEGILSVNLAFSKDIMDDNGTIGLNVSDLFNSRKRMSITDTDTFTSESEFQWRQRQVAVNFTYRFNQKKKRERGNREAGNDDDGDFEG